MAVTIPYLATNAILIVLSCCLIFKVLFQFRKAADHRVIVNDLRHSFGIWDFSEKRISRDVFNVFGFLLADI